MGHGDWKSNARVECQNASRFLLENPFLVLALAPTATPAEVEREGARLLAMLAADLEQARSYATPLGPQRRTPELVRHALAELRDPEKRAEHEWWAEGLS